MNSKGENLFSSWAKEIGGAVLWMVAFIFLTPSLFAGGVLLGTQEVSSSTWIASESHASLVSDSTGKTADAGQGSGKASSPASKYYLELPTINAVGDNTSAIILEGSMMVAGVLFFGGMIFLFPYLRHGAEKKPGIQ